MSSNSSIYSQNKNVSNASNNIYGSSNSFDENSFNNLNNSDSNKKETKGIKDRQNFIDSCQTILKSFISKIDFLLKNWKEFDFPNLNGTNNSDAHMNFMFQIYENYNKLNDENILKEKKIEYLHPKMILAINKAIEPYQNIDYFYSVYITESYNGKKEEKKCENQKGFLDDTIHLRNNLNTLLNKLYDLKNFLKRECHISEKKFEQLGDFLIPNKKNNIKRGTEIYYPPYGWMGIGLYSLKRYQNEDINGFWLNKKEESEWANAYIRFNPYYNTENIKKEIELIINGKNFEEIYFNYKDKRYKNKNNIKGVIE